MTAGSIAMVGTFDVANFGDLLFPVLAENALKLRGNDTPLDLFSLGSAQPFVGPTFSSFTVRSIREFANSMGGMRGLIVGGGDLIRFDSQVVQGYEGDGVLPFPECLWLLPALAAVRCGIPVVWNSPGVVGAIPQWAVPLVAELVEGSAYVAVRDESSLRTLRAAVGCGPEIHVVPDSAFGLSRRRETLQTKQRLPFDVLVHASAMVARALRTDVSLLRKLRRLRVGVVEVGTALGDDVRRVSALLPSATNFRYRGVADVLAAIEDSRSVMSSSLHLTIGARAAGKEVLHFAHPKVRKQGIVSKLRDEQQVARSDFSFGRDASPSRVADALGGTVAEHWNSIGSIFGSKLLTGHGSDFACGVWDATCREIIRVRAGNEPPSRVSFASRVVGYRRPERIVLA